MNEELELEMLTNPVYETACLYEMEDFTPDDFETGEYENLYGLPG